MRTFSILFLIDCISRASAVSIFASRYASRPCSLQSNGNDFCQLSSSLGDSGDGFNGLYMHLGETKCNVTLTRCRKDTCYSFRDLTNQLPTDALTLPPTGLFSSVTVVSGASQASLTREGFSFQASSDTVTLAYSTKNCNDFYWSHGGVPQQLCNQPIEAITQIGTASYSSLDCS